MKFNSTTLLVLLFAFLHVKLNAQPGFRLTKDINAQTDANPSNQAPNGKIPYAVLNGVMYFSANDGINGTEFWRSDGTAAGTYIVKDLEAGETSSNPYPIIVSGNNVFFFTQNSVTGIGKLWCSDGTANGTTTLKDSISQGNYLTDVSGEVYFFMFYNPQLWKTDGTVSGTVLVKDFGSSANDPYYPTAANGLFYFSMFTNSNGRELWRSNGTNAGTFMVKDINPEDPFYSYNYGPTNLTPFHNKLYFMATDGNGYKLWYTNGTQGGTIKVSNQDSIYQIFKGDFSYQINKPFTELNGNLILPAFTSSTGEELFKYNTTSGFSLVKDITPGAAGNDIDDMATVGKKVYFEFSDTLNKADEIWSTDGSSTNTFLVESFDQGELYASHLTAGNQGLLYFVANSKNHGKELWKTNGVPENAKIIKDIFEGSTSSNPDCITRLNDKMFFSAASNIVGTELWQTDGSSTNTLQVTEINTVSTPSSAPTENFYYNALKNFPGSMHGLAMGNTLYFSASKPKTGYELYKSDGTAAGTTLSKDFVSGGANSTPQQFLKKNNSIYFSAENNSYNWSVYKIDSTGTVTKAVPSQPSLTCYDVADNGLIFFTSYSVINSTLELWRSDGTVNGTFLLTDKIQFPGNTSNTQAIRTAGNKVFFVGYEVNYGYELWVSDGTVAGTKMVKDIAAGMIGSSPYSLFPLNGYMIFGASDRSTPYNTLWKSDGTESGTVKISDVTPWGVNSYDNYNNYFCVIGKNLYFNGYDNTAGKYGLWKTNGYKAGTVSVTNVGIPTFLTNINKSLLFLTLSDNNLWISDGTSNGTKMLKNINGFDRYVSERCVAAGKFFLSTNNPDSALWISDGTINGTHLIEDSVIAGLTDIRALTAAENFIFLTGANNKYGDELYVADASNMDKPIAPVITKSKPQTALMATLLENPVTSKISLRIKSSHEDQITVLISNERGFVIATERFKLIKDNKDITINCSKWKSGLYIIKLVNTSNNGVTINVLKQ